MGNFNWIFQVNKSVVELGNDISIVKNAIEDFNIVPRGIKNINTHYNMNKYFRLASLVT